MPDELRPPDTSPRPGGVTIGNVIGGIRNSIIAGRDVIFKFLSLTINIFIGDTDKQLAQRNRLAMLELVRITWVERSLEQSLHGAAMIELGMEEYNEAVKRPWDIDVQAPDRPNRTLPPGTKIIDVFDEMKGVLLILGEPGSGKTTMLLELAHDTIARAKQDPMQPIPVVFNLSSWAEKRQPIVDWLVEELAVRYGISQRIAYPWIEKDNLLLLLDGLDEVKREYREDCVRALNDFRQKHGFTSIVVCSRIADYEALTVHLKSQGAVLLRPLTPEQINKYLDGAGTELLAVRATLQHDATLQELAQSPLTLSVMSLAYKGKSVRDLQSLSTIEAHRRHLFDTYIQQMFKRRSVDKHYSQEQVLSWLAWLARQMIHFSQSIFLPQRMTHSWLETSGQQRLYAILRGLVSWIESALILVIMHLLVEGFGSGGILCALVQSLLVCLIPAGIAYVSVRRTSRTFVIAGQMSWSWTRARHRLGRNLAWGVLLGLVGSATVTFFSSWLNNEMQFGNDKWIARLLVACPNGLLIGVGLGVLATWLSGWSVTEIKIEPEHGLGRPARLASVAWIAPTLSLMTLTGVWIWLLSGDIISGIMFALVVGLLAGVYFSGQAIDRFILRFALWQAGDMPWNYSEFFDCAVERIFLRRVGNGYVFVHRMMMEHLATFGDDAMSHYNRGMAHCRAGEIDQALTEFTRAAELAPDNVFYWVRLCLIGSLLGRAADVLYAGDRAVRLASEDVQAHNARALARSLVGDHRGAIDDLGVLVAWSKKHSAYDQVGVTWEGSIAALQAGRNPFDEKRLQELLKVNLGQ